MERIYAGKLYADVPRGIFLVRGENVLLLGEVVCAYLFYGMLWLLSMTIEKIMAKIYDL